MEGKKQIYLSQKRRLNSFSLLCNKNKMMKISNHATQSAQQKGEEALCSEKNDVYLEAQQRQTITPGPMAIWLKLSTA